MSTRNKQELQPTAGWRQVDTPRILPLTDAQTTLPQRFLLTAIRRIGGLNAENLWRLMLHNFRLMRGMLGFASKMMPNGELPRRDTELAILRVAWNCRCRYEWGQHVDIGMRAGLSREEIARIPSGADASEWQPQQRAILLACDDMHGARQVSDDTWRMLKQHFNDRLLLELLMLIGYYEGLAGVLNSTGLPLDRPLEARLALLEVQRRSPGETP